MLANRNNEDRGSPEIQLIVQGCTAFRIHSADPTNKVGAYALFKKPTREHS